MKKTLKELRAQRVENQKALWAILDKVEAEHRSMTDEERTQCKSLEEENERIDMSIRAYAGQDLIAIADRKHELAENVRRLIRGEIKYFDVEFRSTATAIDTTDAAGTIGQHVGQGVIDPLEQGLILGKLGITMPMGMKWNQKWPTVSAVTATIEGENAIISETEPTIGALNPTPKRVAIQIPVSNAAIDASDDDIINTIIRPQLTAAVQRLLNAWMLKASSAYATGCAGPFVSAGTSGYCSKLEFAGAVPTYAEVLKLRGLVAGEGAFDDGTYAYVMHPIMAAALAATPRGGTGGDRMIIEGGKIDGCPVYESAYIEAGNTDLATDGPLYIGFGRWSDWMVGQFGNMRLAVDNSSKDAAAADVTYFSLNTHFAQNAIHIKAFALGVATISD